MKELHGEGTVTVAAPLARCIDVLAEIDRYPDWYPEVVRSAEVLERDGDGHPSKAQATLHLARGPLVKDFHLLLAVTVDPAGEVKLARIRKPGDQDRFEVNWRLESVGDGHQTQVVLTLDANLDVPRLLPLGGIGDSVAEGFVDALTRAMH
jgi:hypothetical protein